MDKLKFFLYASIVLLVMCVICLLITDIFTLEFWMAVAATAICAVVAVVCAIMIRRKK